MLKLSNVAVQRTDFKLMKTYLQYFFTRFFKTKRPDLPGPVKNTSDELTGRWDNDLDDSSGLHAIWGWAYEFKNDGTGIYLSWDSENKNQQSGFLWKRITDNTIHTKFESEDIWTIIEYSISDITGPYNTRLFKLTDNNYTATDFSKEGFWNSFGALFKEKK